MMLFWGEGFLNKLARLVFYAGVILFCWGWISNVASGRMTTSQYIHKIGTDFQQGISNELGKIRKTTAPIAHNVRTLYGSADGSS